MFLCDIGNTSYHFLRDEKDFKEDVSSFDPALIKEKIYYICVNKKIKYILKDLENWIDLSKKIDMSKYYETMGIDRIVASRAVTDGVIVDAGSAITVDVVKNGKFIGGFIYPGQRAMSKTYKDISPALDYEFNFDIDLNTLPKNSIDAISYGFLKTLHNEVISYNMPIVLTGGDAKEFQKIFIDARVDENLIFCGMKNIITLFEKKLAL
ncbi:type III pantothenate kinase [Sulfurimonas sp.]|uniref:type III pantothenate kinase n=1 Tax=Sulfurimonas sp. TaxID=2022749 RepID=UPI002AAF1D8A|nr:type III pantothenate kinase [Sulfurimonas sp.]